MLPLLVFVLLASAVTAKLPYFTWATPSVFYHAANSSGPFSADVVDFVVDHFAGRPVTIEKMQAQAQAPVGKAAENKIVAAAKAFHDAARARGKEPPMVLFYLNSVMNWDMYDLADEVVKQGLVVMDARTGKPALIRNQTVFDLTKPAMRKLWLGTISTALSSGYIAGVFADRGNFVAPDSWGINVTEYRAAEVEMLQECQRLVNDTGFVISNNEDIDGVGGRMYERWGYVPKDFDQLGPVADIAQLEGDMASGRVAEAHAGEPCSADNFNRSLAQFLVAAGEHAYYGCSDGWTAQTGWDVWYDDYDRPLGAPTGPASKTTGADKSTVFKRSFASGTRVKLTVPTNVKHTEGCVCWGDGATTGPPGCTCD